MPARAFATLLCGELCEAFYSPQAPQRRISVTTLALRAPRQEDLGDFGEPLAHGGARDVPRRDRETTHARPHVRDAEGGPERREAGSVVSAVADEGEAEERGRR